MADGDSRSIKRKLDDSEELSSSQLTQQSTDAGTGFYPEEIDDTREASQLTAATQSSASHGETLSTVLQHDGEEEEDSILTTPLDTTDGDIDDENAKDLIRLQVRTLCCKLLQIICLFRTYTTLAPPPDDDRQRKQLMTYNFISWELSPIGPGNV